jgi:hypothetical protein
LESIWNFISVIKRIELKGGWWNEKIQSKKSGGGKISKVKKVDRSNGEENG